MGFTNIDLTLYNQVKMRFALQKGIAFVITLVGNDIEKMPVQIVTCENRINLQSIARDHQRNRQPYAVIDFEYDQPSYYFCCFEFERLENPATGELLLFELNPLKEIILDLEKVKKQFQQLRLILSGNS